MQPCQHPERLRVALEILEVCALLRGKELIHALSPAGELREVVAEPFTDSVLPEMPERRVPDIVYQPCAAQYLHTVCAYLRGDLRVILREPCKCRISYRTRKGAYLQRMRQPCAHEISPVQRENLRFVLKSAEGRAADYPMIILREFRADITAALCGNAASFGGQQSVPCHLRHNLPLFCELH